MSNHEGIVFDFSLVNAIEYKPPEEMEMTWWSETLEGVFEVFVFPIPNCPFLFNPQAKRDGDKVLEERFLEAAFLTSLFLFNIL